MDGVTRNIDDEMTELNSMKLRAEIAKIRAETEKLQAETRLIQAQADFKELEVTNLRVASLPAPY